MYEACLVDFLFIYTVSFEAVQRLHGVNQSHHRHYAGGAGVVVSLAAAPSAAL